MELINQMFRIFLILAALLLTCLSLSADWLFGGGSLANWLDDCVLIIEAQDRAKQLSHQAQLSADRVSSKGEIAEALKNGQMTLLEAAAYFRWLHEDLQSWHHPFRPRPELNDGASWCREVIEWTDRYTSTQPTANQPSALRQRLEAELQEVLKKQDRLTLSKERAAAYSEQTTSRVRFAN